MRPWIDASRREARCSVGASPRHRLASRAPSEVSRGGWQLYQKAQAPGIDLEICPRLQVQPVQRVLAGGRDAPSSAICLTRINVQARRDVKCEVSVPQSLAYPSRSESVAGNSRAKIMISMSSCRKWSWSAAMATRSPGGSTWDDVDCV